jgi:sialate O-acetylesterase
MKILKYLILLLVWLSASHYLQAEVTLPNVIGNNMVLQRNKPIAIWGFAAKGEKVTVQFGKQFKKCETDTAGHWKVVLDPVEASDKPSEMIITGNNLIKLSNILVGEVWFCSGQSNMEYPMKKYPGYKNPAKGTDLAEEEISKVHNPNIRIFLVEKKRSFPDVTTKGWNEARDSALMRFSAAGYFFAKEIQNELHVPVGIISSSWGGSRIEPWTPLEAYRKSPVFRNDTAKRPEVIDGSVAGSNYNSMILPLVPYSIRGFLWYQGESNCMLNETLRYTEKQKLLVDSWREVWGQNDLPFYYVQIAPYYYTHRKDKLPHTEETLAGFWEAQTLALHIPYTGMVVVTDLVDNLVEIHPSYKWEVGRRLSLLALAKDYGKAKLEYSGPVYQSMKVKGNKIELTFTHIGSGLISSDGKPLTWISVAGPDGKFVPATATISGGKVVVTSAEVKDPKNVRFAWSETAMPNFANKEGLPALPFRTNGAEWMYKSEK